MPRNQHGYTFVQRTHRRTRFPCNSTMSCLNEPKVARLRYRLHYKTCSKCQRLCGVFSNFNLFLKNAHLKTESNFKCDGNHGYADMGLGISKYKKSKRVAKEQLQREEQNNMKNLGIGEYMLRSVKETDEALSKHAGKPREELTLGDVDRFLTHMKKENKE